MELNLELILREIKDKHTQENFSRIQRALKESTILNGEWAIYEVSVPAETTGFRFKHNLNFIPRDVILLYAVGDQNFQFRNEQFTRTHLFIDAHGPVTLRFLAGRYNEFDGLPIYPNVPQPNPDDVGSVVPEDAINATRLRITRIADEAIFAQEVVMAISATHVALATGDDTREKAMVLGIADNDAAIGEDVDVVLLGVVSNAAFAAFTVNDPLFLDVDGGVTNTKRTSGYHVVVGKAVGGNDILFNSENPITIA